MQNFPQLLYGTLAWTPAWTAWTQSGPGLGPPGMLVSHFRADARDSSSSCSWSRTDIEVAVHLLP
jgi:hypothetical protein